MLQRLRACFARRGLLEVDTPILQSGPNRDHGTRPMHLIAGRDRRWLVTSPEHHLKRLLAAGWPDCWCLCPCFRESERGARHNPEFRMLEWYRLDWDDRRLADETCAVINTLIADHLPIERLTYRSAFQQHAGVDPLTATDDEIAAALGDQAVACAGDRGALLDLLLCERVEPHLGWHGLCILTDYPGDQAAQARWRHDADGHLLAARFEIYWQGIELANGYHECTDPDEIARRLATHAATHAATDDDPAQDARFLAALRHGLPDCAGVALGFDRLLMLHCGHDHLDAVLTFPWERT